MSEEQIKLVLSCFLCSAITFVICVVCIAIPVESEMKEFKKQAVENGYAEYKTDSDGVTVFTWKAKE